MNRKAIIIIVIIAVAALAYYFLYSKSNKAILPQLTDAEIAALLNQNNITPTPSLIDDIQKTLKTGVTIAGAISALGTTLGIGGSTTVATTGAIAGATAAEGATTATAATTGTSVAGAGVLVTAGIVIMAAAVAYFLYTGIKGVFDGGNYSDLLFNGDKDKDWARLQWWLLFLPENDNTNFYIASIVGLFTTGINANSTNNQMRAAIMNSFNSKYPGIINPINGTVSADFKPVTSYTFIGDGVNKFVPVGSVPSSGGGAQTVNNDNDPNTLPRGGGQVAESTYEYMRATNPTLKNLR